MAKLVRDNVPAILQSQGENPTYHVASNEEYWTALLAKFKEEVDEFLDESNEAEFSDILELVDEIVKQIGEERVRDLRAQKAKQKGTFSQRIILDHD